MNRKFLIIGGGVSGLSLAWALEREGIDYRIADDSKEDHASVVAAGLINPISGREYYVQVYAEELIQHADDCFGWWSKVLNEPVIRKSSILRIHRSQEAKHQFEIRKKSLSDFWIDKETPSIPEQYNAPHGGFFVKEARIISTRKLYRLAKKWLESQNKWYSGSINHEDIKWGSTIETAAGDFTDVILANGIQSVEWKALEKLPFRYNKGEAVIFNAPKLPEEHAIIGKAIIVPQGNNEFWAGSFNKWGITSCDTTTVGRNFMEECIPETIKVDYDIIWHGAGIRPAIKDRAPVVGTHPLNKQLHILNGMGTKGYSLAPLHANKLSDYLINGSDLQERTSLNRYF